MTDPTWIVAVDLNGDGDYSDADENISAYMMAMNFQNGFGDQFAPVARDNTATIILKNDSKRFSPESASVFSADWTRGKRIRIQSTDPTGPTTRTMYVGWIDQIIPTPGTRAARTCTVRCASYLDRLQTIEAFVPIQESKTADQVIDAIVNNAGVFPPGIGARWILGIVGRSELGETTHLGSVVDWLTAEVGKTTFNYIGDRWGDGVSVLAAFRDTMLREAGRLYVDRSGIVQFRNRHSLILDTTSDQTFDETMSGLDYSFGDRVFNAVTVRANPRKVGAAPEALARLDRATKIEAANPTKIITFRYKELTAGGARIGGRNAIAPVATTDYTANAAENGSGADLTGNISAKITKESSTGCEVTYTSTAAVDAWLQSGFQIRGTAIRDYGRVSATRQIDSSVDAYGFIPYTYPGEMDNISDAEGMADFIASRDAVPKGISKTVKIEPRRNATMLTAGLARTIFDRITLIEPQTGMSKDYFIISERHAISRGKKYSVTWGIEPAESNRYWILGVAGFSELGETTWAGPF